MSKIQRPQQNEYNPHYKIYVDLVKTGIFLEVLDENTKETINFFNSIDISKHHYKYAENKWTIKDVLMHIIDSDRGYSYRTIVCVRGDNKIPLYPMDEILCASNVDTTNRTMESLIEEFLAVRNGMKMIFEHTTEEQSKFFGNGIDHKITARALGYITIGHAIHHTNVIKERYL